MATDMSHETIARWQFAITTVYHFLFVPLTIGLSLLVAVMQTVWNRTGNVEWLRLTRFWGKLMLINFAMGIVTGIVQEFQFGMNWSDYSRFVGDVFGAPLAMEALIAFFLESTFLGLWIFGWDRLPRNVHLATIWLASLGTVISAYFILAANSWMQHPVGYRINPDTGHAELTSIWQVLTNPTQLVTFPHVLAASLLTGGAVIVGLSCWHLRRGHQVELHGRAVRLGLVVCAVASVGVMASGHFQGQVMTRQQPMKMASAEALWETERGAGLSLFAYGDVSHGENKIDIKLPRLLSFMATNSFSGTVQGVNDVQAAEAARYGPGDYSPVMGVTFWNFRAMMGLGAVYFGLAMLGLFRMRGGHLPGGRYLLPAFVWASALPYLANTAGWIFTEMGRQPWAVFGLLRTSDAVSPGVSTTAVIATLAGFTVIYGTLAAVALRLFLHHGRHEIPALSPNVTVGGRSQPGGALPSLAY
ncbi:cytochrome ubiquinol oxidase subunit I [Frankia sp. CIT1]|uniref:cytochrome ubiquinol oxidase subunit I n=1 Tax=Frankia sp. CIT1 TaxID=2880974 RepID=UPI00351D4E6A